jgi:hypothetical protein
MACGFKSPGAFGREFFEFLCNCRFAFSKLCSERFEFLNGKCNPAVSVYTKTTYATSWMQDCAAVQISSSLSLDTNPETRFVFSFETPKARRVAIGV